MLNRQFFAALMQNSRRPCVQAVLVLAALPSSASAQSATDFFARAGVMLSSALVKDAVASADGAETVTSRIAPAPYLAVGVRQALAPRLAFEVQVGYTFGSWQADDSGGWRDVQSVGVAEASLALARSYGNVSAHGAIGALSYRAPARGIFEGEAGMRPFLEAGGGWRTPFAARRLELRAAVQAHKFGTSGIRSAGGLDGSVARVAVSAGYTFGGGR